MESGHLLGIDDRYNFCNEDNVDFTRRLCSFYLDKITKPAFKTLSAEYEHMARAVSEGARYYQPGVTYESLFAYNAFAIDLKADHVRRQMTYSQRFHYIYLRFVFGVLCWIPGVMRFFNILFKFCITLVVNPPSWWPSSWRPARVQGLAQFWSSPARKQH